MPWFALQTGGVWLLAVIITVATAFRALGTYVMAPWVNTTGSRRVLIWTDLLRAVVMIVFAALAFWGKDMMSNSVLTAAILLLAGLNAFLMGWFAIGMQVYIPTIAENLRKANADLATGRNMVELTGYLTGGLMTAWFTSSGFILNSLTFLVAGIAMAFIGGGEPTEERKSRESLASIFGKWSSQWKTARKVITSSFVLSRIFWLMIITTICFAPIGTMLAPLASQLIGGGPLLLGILEGAIAVGGILAGLLARKTKWNDYGLMLTAVGLCGLAQLGSVLFGQAAAVILLVAMFGLGQNMYRISQDTVVQSTDPEMRAPIFAVLILLLTLFYPLASLATAQLTQWTSLKVPFVTGGLLAVGTAAVMAVERSRRQRTQITEPKDVV